jgi:hypothetical protein
VSCWRGFYQLLIGGLVGCGTHVFLLSSVAQAVVTSGQKIQNRRLESTLF